MNIAENVHDDMKTMYKESKQKIITIKLHIEKKLDEVMNKQNSSEVSFYLKQNVYSY